jgi:hypothetical protein
MTCAELANADTARYTCAQFIGIIDRSRRKPGILQVSTEKRGFVRFFLLRFLVDMYVCIMAHG